MPTVDLQAELADPPHIDRPLIVRSGDCVIKLFDVWNLTKLTMPNIRKLMKIMFGDVWQNQEPIKLIGLWLTEANEVAQVQIEKCKSDIVVAQAEVYLKQSQKAVMGTGYWENRVDSLREARDRAESKKSDEKLVSAIKNQLSVALAARDAPIYAERALAKAKKKLDKHITESKRTRDLQTLFYSMSKKYLFN